MAGSAWSGRLGLERETRLGAGDSAWRAGWTTAGGVPARAVRALGGDEGEVEARCLMALSLWIGNHFLVADRKVRSRAEVLERAGRLLEG
jgi:hypothetical protein